MQCEECGKCCVNSSALKVHMLMHDDPQFKCSYCEKKLKNKGGNSIENFWIEL